MAKWGEGDPRWIVEERPDATNVNNWHWKERNATQWSKDKLTELLSDLSFDDANWQNMRIKSVEFGNDCEATVNNRKGKLIFLYEWHMTLNVTGYNSRHEEVTGVITIPNLEDQEPLADVDIDFSQQTPKETDTEYASFFKETVRPFLRDKLGQYISALNKEYSGGLILPVKGDSSTVTTCGIQATKQTSTLNGVTTSSTLPHKPSPSVSSSTSGIKIETISLEHSEKFQASMADVYEAFLDKPRVEAFTGGPAQLERERGGRFSLYGGAITGFVEDMKPPTEVSFRWRQSGWREGIYSKVCMTLSCDNFETTVKLVQTGIPSESTNEEIMKQGWKDMYWIPMKTKLALGFVF